SDSELKNCSKTDIKELTHDNFIYRTNRYNNKKHSRKNNNILYDLSNFNSLFGHIQRRGKHILSVDVIYRCIDLITLQQNLVRVEINYNLNILNCKKVDILFCINILIYNKVYNLADNVINMFRWQYVFTYCLACFFCLLIHKSLSFLYDVIQYIKIKLSDYDINIFVLHIIYLYLKYKNKLKYMYENIDYVYKIKEKDKARDIDKDIKKEETNMLLNTKVVNMIKNENTLTQTNTSQINASQINASQINANKCNKLLEQSSELNKKENSNKITDINTYSYDEHVNNILAYIKDNDFLFYCYTLIYIHDKKEYKKLFKNIKKLLFKNLKKTDIYKTMLCVHKYTKKNKKINYNFIYDHLFYFKKYQIKKLLSIVECTPIDQDFNFSKMLSLATINPDDIKKKIISQIMNIYNISITKVDKEKICL
ncbi:conserved protein, unknown function, partial [Hepatocystis sp. ex Piliocolobus tephrosceles]